MGEIKYSKIDSIDYFLVYMIIALSGFEFFFRAVWVLYFVVGPIAAYVFFIKRRKISKQFLFFNLLFILWSTFQIAYNLSTVSALFNFYLKFIVYYFSICAINDFCKTFVKVIYHICCISLFFYLITLIDPIKEVLINAFSFIKPLGGGIDAEVTTNPGQSMIIYFIPFKNTLRNSGPFWEPGMFSVFINIALSVSLLANSANRKLDKVTKLLIITSFTTLSTSGYIATFFVLIYYYAIIKRQVKSILYIVLLIVPIIIFINSDFGAEKIIDASQNDASHSRFGAIGYHVSLMRDNPFTGIGFHSDTEFGLDVSPNGLSLIFLFWGIPAAIVYYILLFKSTKVLIANSNDIVFSLKNVWLVYIVLLLVAFSQDITQRHFYYTLLIYFTKTDTKQLMLR